jgi:hypothetical protein
MNIINPLGPTPNGHRLSEPGEPTTSPNNQCLGWVKAVWTISAVAFLIFAAFVLTRPMLWLVGYMADDGFYYLQTARHIAASGRSTFDGINPTNGYHPGWMFLMVTCAKVSPNREVLVRLCLAVGLSLHFLTSLLIVRAFTRYVGEMWSWIIAAIWLLNPFQIRLAILGVEASLLVLALLVELTVWQDTAKRGFDSTLPMAERMKPLILFAIALAGVVYARTDQLVLVALILCNLTYHATISKKSLRVQLIPLLVIAATFLVCLMPWLVYSHAQVGTILQDSGVMKQLWMDAVLQHAPDDARTTLMFLSLPQFWFGQPITGLLGPFRTTNMAYVWGVSALLTVCFAACAKAPAAPFRWLTVFSAGYLLILGCIYGYTMYDFQAWHFAVTGQVVFLAVFGWLALAIRHGIRSEKHQLVAGVAIWGVAFIIPVSSVLSSEPHFLWQRDVYLSQRKFEAEIPANATIGSINAGIPAFFSPHTVINLDGLVNHRVVGYWKNGTFDRYLHDQGIDYVTEEPASLDRAQHFSHNRLPLTLLDSAPLRGLGDLRRGLYSVTSTKSIP